MKQQGWEVKLYEYLEASKNLEFEWGQNDCSLWAAKFVDSVTGSIIANDWLGLYGNEDSANLLMLERGFINCEMVADSIADSKRIKLASRGDIVLHESGALGICDGRKSYFLTPEKGLVSVLTITCKKAWSI
jgi:hypothetical protein